MDDESILVGQNAGSPNVVVLSFAGYSLVPLSLIAFNVTSVSPWEIMFYGRTSHATMFAIDRS